MDSISFQNGFVCGLATKGLVKSGAAYEPEIYNDSGVYDFFYLDFKRVMETFSLGQFNESIIVFDSQQVSVSKIEKFSDTVYKIYCNLSTFIHGVTVLNKKTTRLKFSTGEVLPVFSVHTFIAGLSSYLDAGYLFDKCDFSQAQIYDSASDTGSAVLSDAFSIGSLSDTAAFSPAFMNSAASDTATVVLT